VKLAAGFCVILSAGNLLQAQDPAANSAWRFRFGGYWKNLFTASSSFIVPASYGDDMNRLRLTLDGRGADWLEFHVDYDNEAHLGNRIGLPDFNLVRGRQDAAYFDLQHILVDRDHVYWDTSLYRGFVRLRRPGVVVSLGRQRIAWGTARFWSPADLFNPLNPLEVESDERQGVDAAQLEWTLANNVRWTTVYVPQDRFRRSTTATRFAGTVGSYDLAVFAGRFGEDWVGGSDFAGQWHGAGLRGEMTYRWRRSDTSPNALRLAFGADYAFPNSFYLIGEYFYNQGQPAGSFDPRALVRFTSEIFTLNRHFLSGGVGYDVTPLFRVEGYTVADVRGGSMFFMPVLKYNLAANVDLSAGGELFASRERGEFKQVPNLFYVQTLVHF
jgi:hypothetical protein